MREQLLNRGHVYAERVSANHAGRTVVEHLALRYQHTERSAWRTRIAEGEVRLDGSACAPDQLLRAGQRLAWHRAPWQEPDVPIGFAILHRDADCLAVAKPRGLPTLPGGGRFQEHTLLHQVQRHFPEAHPVHRLGAGTSGALLFARRPAAARDLAAAFATGAIRRIYRGLVVGDPAPQPFEVDLPIGPVPHPRLGSLHAVSPRGRAARSLVTPLERRSATTLVEVEIATGRTHQIRIHLAAVGHPLVGDPLYAAGGSLHDDALPTDGGFWLHAAQLEWVDARGQSVAVACTPPPILRRRDEPGSSGGNLPDIRSPRSAAG